jgi:Tol biopolymer transport system component
MRRKGLVMRALAVSLGLLVSLPLRNANAQSCDTSQLTVLPGGVVYDGGSRAPVISRNGRYVAFVSDATNTGLSPYYGQIYLLDRTSGALELITQDPNGGSGAHAPGTSSQFTYALSISADGRFVLFATELGTLVANDTNTPPPLSFQGAGMNVFVRDRATGATITPDRLPDGTTGSGISHRAVMSAYGRWIAFSTSNPIDPLDTDVTSDAYLFDSATGTTILVGLTSTGAKPNDETFVAGISDDGRYVLLTSDATDMLPADTNGKRDVFLRDRVTGSVELISVATGGLQGNQASDGVRLSPDARFVLFQSSATNWPGHLYALPDLFVRDRNTSTTFLVSARDNGTPAYFIRGPFAMSADAHFVLWGSSNPGMTSTDVNHKDDVFLRDTLTATTTLVSAQPSGTTSAAHSYSGDITPDGRTIVFSSKSNVLTTPGIVNMAEDIFVRECTPASPTIYCVAAPTSTGCAPSIAPSGTPSASMPNGFDIALTGTRNQKLGILFYGLSGPTTVPYFGHWLCVEPPVTRTGLSNTGGSPSGDDCTGSMHFDFNARIASGVDPALASGAQVNAQYWTRDGGSASGVHLSNALWFSIGP